jgi:tetratricopeptide (TPR) repeat protein
VGLDGLRTAAAMSEQLSDGPLRARVSLSLGSALVHAARGFDEEGAAHLHRAVTLAGEHGPPLVAATASRELAYVELLRGRYERARRWLESAALWAGDDDGEAVWIAAVRGACETDVGSYPAARSWLEVAAERARRSGVEVPGAFAFCFLGRFHLLREELDDAHAHLSTSLEMARRAGWTSFVPFPLSLMGEVCRLRGDVEGAGTTYEHAFEMSCRLGDPCWESLGARGLGLVAADRGDAVGAMSHLRDAPVTCRRFPDSYLWIEAFALEAACRVAVAARSPHALLTVGELESLTVRTGMRELAARALLHRAALGDVGARQLARSAVAQIDNPALAMAAASVLR